MKSFLVVACLFLTGCGVWRGVTGNDIGGIIPYSLVDAPGGNHRAVAQQMASQHCAGYRKFAVIKSMPRQLGDYVAFDCKWSLQRP
jgi:hypothetical protein